MAQLEHKKKTLRIASSALFRPSKGHILLPKLYSKSSASSSANLRLAHLDIPKSFEEIDIVVPSGASGEVRTLCPGSGRDVSQTEGPTCMHCQRSTGIIVQLQGYCPTATTTDLNHAKMRLFSRVRRFPDKKKRLRAGSPESASFPIERDDNV
jgi:hypothetical protein